MTASFAPLIWDVDGTISNSGTEIFDRVNRVMAEIGHEPLPETTLQKFIGPPLIESFTHFTDLTHEQAQDAVSRARDIARNRPIEEMGHPYPGVLELIRDAHKAGISQAVASSKGQFLVDDLLTHYGVIDCFQAVYGADLDRGIIHKPQMIGRAVADLEAQGIPLTKPLMIGDRIHDLEGAAEHGIPTVIVEWGFGAGEATPDALARVRNAQELRTTLGL